MHKPPLRASEFVCGIEDPALPGSGLLAKGSGKLPARCAVPLATDKHNAEDRFRLYPTIMRIFDMVYDWTGARTRRIRRIKLAAASIVALIVVAVPVLAIS